MVITSELIIVLFNILINLLIHFDIDKKPITLFI